LESAASLGQTEEQFQLYSANDTVLRLCSGNFRKLQHNFTILVKERGICETSQGFQGGYGCHGWIWKGLLTTFPCAENFELVVEL